MTKATNASEADFLAPSAFSIPSYFLLKMPTFHMLLKHHVPFLLILNLPQLLFPPRALVANVAQIGDDSTLEALIERGQGLVHQQKAW